MKNNKFRLFLLLSLLVSCVSPTPTLCECLTNPKYANIGDSNYEKCKQVFKDRYGTNEPSMEQMKNDYYNCKSK